MTLYCMCVHGLWNEELAIEFVLNDRIPWLEIFGLGNEVGYSISEQAGKH